MNVLGLLFDVGALIKESPEADTVTPDKPYKPPEVDIVTPDEPYETPEVDIETSDFHQK